MRKNVCATRAAFVWRSLQNNVNNVKFLTLTWTDNSKSFILHSYFNSAPTSPFVAYFDNNIEFELQAIIAQIYFEMTFSLLKQSAFKLSYEFVTKLTYLEKKHHREYNRSGWSVNPIKLYIIFYIKRMSNVTCVLSRCNCCFCCCCCFGWFVFFAIQICFRHTWPNPLLFATLSG